MAQLFRGMLGAVVGMVGFSIVVGSLDDLFRPYPDDMAMWLLYSLPAGAVFGGLTGWALAVAAHRKANVIGGLIIPMTVVLAVSHGMLIWDSMQRLSSSPSRGISRAVAVYAFAQYGPGLLWALLLLALGAYCVLGRHKVQG